MCVSRGERAQQALPPQISAGNAGGRGKSVGGIAPTRASFGFWEAKAGQNRPVQWPIHAPSGRPIAFGVARWYVLGQAESHSGNSGLDTYLCKNLVIGSFSPPQIALVRLAEIRCSEHLTDLVSVNSNQELHSVVMMIFGIGLSISSIPLRCWRTIKALHTRRGATSTTKWCRQREVTRNTPTMTHH